MKYLFSVIQSLIVNTVILSVSFFLSLCFLVFKMSVIIIKSKGPIPLGLIGFAVVVLLDIFYRRKKSKLQVFLIIKY